MKSIISILCVLITYTSFSQSLLGLWTVDEVTVGNRVLTPVAKWFRINENGIVQSGNGWTQNNLATWTYDESKHYLLPKNMLRAPDPFGGFYVTLTDQKMIWKRIEEGDSVTVTLSRANELPMAPADSIQGNWVLQETESSDSTTIKELNIRPDRLFNYTQSNDKRAFGYWHMDGHNPRFSLIDFDKDIADRVFRVSFDKNELIMKTEEKDYKYIRQL